MSICIRGEAERRRINRLFHEKRLLVIATRPTDVEIIAPAIIKLQESGYKINVLSTVSAASTFKLHKIEPDDIVFSENFSKLLEVSNEARRFEPHAILTGTSMQLGNGIPTLEQWLWFWGTANRIESVAMLNTVTDIANIENTKTAETDFARYFEADSIFNSFFS